MKLSLSWLKKFVDLPMSPSQIAKTLTTAGLEVDSVETRTPRFSKVVVARVLETAPHPNADKLCVAKVSDGLETFQVVCGAPNCRAGLKTALALQGAEITETDGSIFKIKKGKLRGVESFGMLCSGKELGLSEESDGIIEFSESLKEGTDVASLYGETLFEISLTPNLNYASSVAGVARELAAYSNLKFKAPEKPSLKEDGGGIPAEAVIEDTENCPRYAFRVVKDVKVKASPDWLKKLIEDSGLRSVNNVVDATNYVLLMLGQPLHAFDLDRVKGSKIVVRAARKGEKITTLDGKERDLDVQNLVIADEKDPIALAGVMGGINSEVSENTRTVLIESAYFKPSSIRKTSKQFGLQSDASRRFERGCDPNQVILALDIAASLIADIAEGKVCQGFKDIKARDFPELEIDCRLSRIHSILGIKISLNEVETIFQRLGFKVKTDGLNILTVTVPTYRVDILSEIDLIEDVAKVFGYDNIKRESPNYNGSQMPHSAIYPFEKEVKRKLIAEGLQEFITCDLIGPKLLFAAYGKEDAPENSIAVLNPVSVEQSILRTSLLPGLLEVVKHNFDRENHEIAGFEVGRLHFKQGDKIEEDTALGIILSGASSSSTYDPAPRDFDFRDLKGIVENFLKGIGIEGYSIRKTSISTLHPGRQAGIYVQGQELGAFGEVHPAVIRRLDIPRRIMFAEMSLPDLFMLRKKDIKMKPLPVYPSSERDWTITLLEKAPARQVVDVVHSIPSKLLEKVSLINIFRGSQVGQDKKNCTFRFIYRDKDKTISLEDVEMEHKRLIAATLDLIGGCLPEN